MSSTDAEKPKKKDIVDIEKPEDAKPSSTSKPVIVSNRPVLKDPMVVEKAEDDEKPSEKAVTHDDELKHTGSQIIQPLNKPDADEKREPEPKPEPPSPTPATPPKNEPPAEEPKPSEPTGHGHDDQAKPPAGAKKLSAEEAKKAEHDAEIQKLVDEGQYALPISTAEKRQTKRFIVLGAVAAIVLVLVWIDIALDASLIHLGGLHPATHFFSN